MMKFFLFILFFSTMLRIFFFASYIFSLGHCIVHFFYRYFWGYVTTYVLLLFLNGVETLKSIDSIWDLHKLRM